MSAMSRLYPVLTAIMISRDDGAAIERPLRSVVSQSVDVPFEVVVVTSGAQDTADVVRRWFPSVTLVHLKRPAFPGEARNAGLSVARGEYVSFPGSHVELPSGSLHARVQAHRKGYSMVTGAVMNGTRSCAGWASYFLDHSSSLPGRPSGELAGPPAHCSYSRDSLLRGGRFPEDMRAGEDTVMNRRLWDLGFRGYRSNKLRLYHNNPCRTPIRLVHHHWVRGKAWGHILADRGKASTSLTGYLSRRLRRTDENLRSWGDGLHECYRRVRPLVIMGAAAACVGMWYGWAVRRLT